MQPHIHAITLAVEDLERALAFYRDGLGLESTGIFGAEFAGDETNPSGAVAMFHLKGGLILAVWPRSELAKDAQAPFGSSKTGEFSLGHAVASMAAVDALIAQAEAAQGRRCPNALMSVPGASTPATSAIRMRTCGRSCGTGCSRTSRR